MDQKSTVARSTDAQKRTLAEFAETTKHKPLAWWLEEDIFPERTNIGSAHRRNLRAMGESGAIEMVRSSTGRRIYRLYPEFRQ